MFPPAVRCTMIKMSMSRNKKKLIETINDLFAILHDYLQIGTNSTNLCRTEARPVGWARFQTLRTLAHTLLSWVMPPTP